MNNLTEWGIRLVSSSQAVTSNAFWKYLDSSAITPAYVSGLTATKGGVTKNITAVTKANPAVFTINSHGYSNGDIITLGGSANPSDYDILKNPSSATTEKFKISDKSDNAFLIKYLNENAVSNFVDIICSGCLPHLLDESEVIDVWGGGYRRTKQARLAFDIVMQPLVAQGDFDAVDGNKVYWDLMKVCQSKYFYIYEFGSQFWRTAELQSLFPATFQMPILVEVHESGKIAPDFAQNQVRFYSSK